MRLSNENDVQKTHVRRKQLGFGIIQVMAVAFLLLFVAAPVLAQPAVILDNKPLTFDVAPVIENGRTLVPLRAILEPLGTVVNWDDVTQTVSAQKGDKIVTLTIGSANAYVDQRPVLLDVPGKIVNGRTMVPLRFVSESFGAKVQYDDISHTILIFSDPNTPDYVSYSNRTNGITMLHPADWEAVENDVSGDSIIKVTVMFMSPDRSSLNIVTEQLPAPLSLDFYTTLAIKQLKSAFADISIIDTSSISIGGLPAQTITYEAKAFGVNVKNTATCIIYKDKAYVATYGGPPEKYDTYSDVAQTMISTLRINN